MAKNKRKGKYKWKKVRRSDRSRCGPNGSKAFKEYHAWRKKVLARDGYICQFPGCSSKRYLHVHHIKRFADYPSLRLEVSNGIILCKTCHDKVKDKEHIYAPIFWRIINERNSNN